MKSKTINAALCDARTVSEEALAGFERIEINAAVLLTNPQSRELLNRYPVTVNSAAVINIPDGVTVQYVNGKHEIGPDADGNGVFLLVNGKLTLENGSLEAAKRYTQIRVNGKVLMPRSCKGQLQNLTVNGKSEYYPDGAILLKRDTEIDDLFAARASGQSYYCSGDIFFLEPGLDQEKLLEKGLRFSARRIVIAERLLNRLLPLFDEESELVRVPDGTRRIDDDLKLEMKTVRKYGPKLYVCGDVSIRDADALSALEYLYADGTVRVSKPLLEAFEKIQSDYDELKIIDPDTGYLKDRPAVTVSTALLKRYPNGLRIEDCAKVTLSADLTPDMILEKLKISDCALVLCSEPQEDAVTMIAEDVARIRTDMAGEDAAADRMPQDTQVINAAEYRL